MTDGFEIKQQLGILADFGIFASMEDGERTKELTLLGEYLKEHIIVRPGAPHIHGCDGSFSMTTSWLQNRRGKLEFMCDLAWLLREGAHCDCEVLINVMPKHIE